MYLLLFSNSLRTSFNVQLVILIERLEDCRLTFSVPYVPIVVHNNNANSFINRGSRMFLISFINVLSMNAMYILILKLNCCFL